MEEALRKFRNLLKTNKAFIVPATESLPEYEIKLSDEVDEGFTFALEVHVGELHKKIQIQVLVSLGSRVEGVCSSNSTRVAFEGSLNIVRKHYNSQKVKFPHSITPKVSLQKEDVFEVVTPELFPRFNGSFSPGRKDYNYLSYIQNCLKESPYLDEFEKKVKEILELGVKKR